MRFFQSSGPINLPPGGSGTIVVAYIFAAPVSVSGCPGAACDVKPANTNADLTILGDPARMAGGVNKIDTMMGYAGNINGEDRGSPPEPDPDPTVVTQDEFLTVPGSLLRKAQTAQSVFDNKFLLPFAPERPEFFLVPGDRQVTVLWAPSPTEDPANPDPFFVVASDVVAAAVRPELPGATTWRATGSTGAGWTTRPSCSCWPSTTTRRMPTTGKGIMLRLPRGGEPDPAVRAGAQRRSSPATRCCSRPRRRARRSWAPDSRSI